jgi:hypothetical protein
MKGGGSAEADPERPKEQGQVLMNQVYQVFHLLNSLIPDLKTFPPMHKSGNVIIENTIMAHNECLFDSGAESDNL